VFRRRRESDNWSGLGHEYVLSANIKLGRELGRQGYQPQTRRYWDWLVRRHKQSARVRLNLFPVHLPALREMAKNILGLALVKRPSYHSPKNQGEEQCYGRQ